MNRMYKVLLALLLVLSFAACSDDDDGPGMQAGTYTITVTPSQMLAEDGEAQQGGVITQGDLSTDNIELFLVAEPATGVNPLNTKDFWGTKLARMTKSGTGAAQTWSLSFSATELDLGAWGDSATVNCKVFVALTADDFWSDLAPGFLAIPGGGGNLGFANITLLGVNGTATAESHGSGAFFAAGEVFTWSTCVATTNAFALPYAYLSGTVADGGIVAAATTNLAFTFNKAVAASQIVAGKLANTVVFTLTNDTAGASVLNNASVAVDAWTSNGGKTINIPVSLINANDYTVTFSNLVSTDGLTLVNPISIGFSALSYRSVALVVDASFITHDPWTSANVHLWNGSFEVAPPGWPGVVLTDLGSGVYSNQISVAGGFNLIFNNSGAGMQTETITVDGSFNGGTYVINNTNNLGAMTGTW